MDIQIPFIFVSIFSLASILLIFIYKFGIKEKSYEEALAEQRQQTHILLSMKPKLKEKKNKKPSKKTPTGLKERPTLLNNEINIEYEATEPIQTEVSKKVHVEFKEAVEDSLPKPSINKKQVKKEKIRPILISKEKPENVIEKHVGESLTFTTNNFEEIHPKDEYELIHSTTPEKQITSEQEKNIFERQLESHKQNRKKQPEVNAVPIQSNKELVSLTNGHIGNVGKEKKKKKVDSTNLQLAGDTRGTNITVFLNHLRNAELSRSEVQILIDLLLNKQHEAPAKVDEWSEGKSDPVQKLKKQLAEKEKLLLEEQQALTSAQAKLREIRSEYQNEKSSLLQKMRGMEEIIHAKQLESTRNLQQIQQLQNQMKEEAVKYHKLREEHTAVQMQRQQFEMRLSQAQDSEVIINKLQSEIQEISNMNNGLRVEMAHLTEENITEKERSKALMIQLNNFQKELEQKNERNRQLEDIRIQLERDLELVIKKEKEIPRLNSIIQQQNEEIRRLEHNTKQYHDDLQKHKEESNKLINQLTTDLRQAQEENRQMKVTYMNGSIQETKQHEVEILNLHNELSSVKSQLGQFNKKNDAELSAANALCEKLKKEIEELKLKYNEQKLKLEEQKEKNNDLRERNWKVMEALNAAECKLKSKISEINVKSEEDIQREFIQRLFPEVKDQEITNSELFKVRGEEFLKQYINNLRKQNVKCDNNEDVHQLKLQLHHYENVIDNTEKMLNNLQTHIEKEEINWRKKLEAKNEELEALKEIHRKEMQGKLTELDVNSHREQEETNGLIAQCKSQVNAQNLGQCTDLEF